MKVNELIGTLQNCNMEAEVILCYEHCEKDSKPQCYYKQIENIAYNQILANNKIIINEKVLEIWGE